MAVGIIVLLVVGLWLAVLVALGVGGIGMMTKGKMSGLVLLLLSGAGGVATLLVTAYLFMVNRPSDSIPPIRLSTVVASDDAVPATRGEPYVEISAGRHNASSPITSLEPMPSPVLGPVVIPEGRPEWVEAPPTEQNDTLYVAVNSGPYVTGLESRRALDEQLIAATDDYIQEVLERPDAAEHVSYSAREIHSFWVEEEYAEVIEVSVGPMHQSHARLKFDREFMENVKERWGQVVIASRIAAASLFFLAGIAILGAVYLFLRLDTATRGYYTGRLQFSAGVTILGIIAAGVLVATWIPWL